MAADDASGVRLAEIVAALSLAVDLGLGQPQEHVLRQTVLARRLAAVAGLSARQQAAAFYVSLLAWVGCVSDSFELGTWFGDDLGLRADAARLDKVPGMSTMRFMLGRVGAGSGPARRLTMMGRLLLAGPERAARSMLAHCQSNAEIAGRLGLGDEVVRPLGQAFERWDGRGVPGRCRGEDLDVVMRVVQVADDATVFHRDGGAEGAVAVLRSRRGTEFDPRLVDLFCSRPAELLEGLEELDAWDVVLDTNLGEELNEGQLTDVLRIFGDYADLKSPSWLGHSRGVATLAMEAARRLGMPAGESTLVERAALVHDLGSIGVSAGVWEKPGRFSTAERERARTHPYLTERTLARPQRLAEIGALACLHHERLDGSGYPHGRHGDGLPLAARVLAAADVYHAVGETRPHRDARRGEQAVGIVREEVVAGRLDGDAVNAVLIAAGHRVRRRPALPAGLTPREAEVLVLVARGMSNKQIATKLSLSPHTVGRHVEHVYTKIGVSTRGAAALFAMRHGLFHPASGGDKNMG